MWHFRSTHLRLAGILCLATLLVACRADGSLGSPPVIGEGQSAPDFRLPTLGGQLATLSQYRGKVVLINLWATWCKPCREEIPELRDAFLSHQPDGFVVLGVSVGESRDEVSRFLAETDVPYPVLLDEERVMMEKYRAVGLPTSILVDRQGIVRGRKNGPLSRSDLAGYLETLRTLP